ncbi:MAG: response regulator, partial [Gemmatimonadetes bacterium]|nr:response regulator [Gemmatimonadota bacterium]
GTGLGLAMVYGIVTGHGGGIVVESAPGAGTRLDAYLPALDVPETAALATEAPAAVPRGTETILVIDDEQDLRDAMSRILRYLGYTVVEAENGRVGLERFDEIGDRVSLVVLDVVMPEMSGVETFRQLRARRPGLPVLVCSGYSAPEDIQVLLDLGATAFLPKPFDAIELGGEVRRILDSVPRPPDLA